jgi:hypothetical protein
MSEMNDSKVFVLGQFPRAYVCKTKGAVDIRRPRTQDDPTALVGYVLMSGYHLTDLLAWDDAARRIENK